MRLGGTSPRMAALAYEQCGREGPEVMFVFAAMSAVATVSLLVSNGDLGWGFALGNLVMFACYAGGAVVIRWRLVDTRWSPSITAAAFAAGVLVQSWQYPIIGVAALGASLLLMSSYGAIVLTWPPFLVAGVVMMAATVPRALAEESVTGVNWIGIQASALFVSGVLLWVRRRALLQLARAKDDIERLATHDQLTGLLNRHGLEVSLPALAGKARRDGQPVFSVFVDISGLKAVNDTYGHLAGDAVIRATAEAVTSVSRDSDLATRWGGDEFVVVGIGEAPEVDQLRARILSAVDRTGLPETWVPQVGVGAASRPDADLDQLVHEADAAMYRGRRGE